MSTISLFSNIEKKHDLCGGKDSMKKFSEYLLEHAMKINFDDKENDIINKQAAKII